MADHPETTALRLAEAATGASAVRGPWRTVEMEAGTLTRVRAPEGLMHADVWAWHGDKARQALAAHIAHAHPGRVRAWLGAVARLRERVAEGHSGACRQRPASGVRGRWDYMDERPCTCGHDLDLAALGAVDAEG